MVQRNECINNSLTFELRSQYPEPGCLSNTLTDLKLAYTKQT